MVARGLPPVLSAWVYVPCLQGHLVSPLRSPCQRDGTPDEGCLIVVRPGVSGHTRWRNGMVHKGNHHYGEGGDVRERPPPVVSWGPRGRHYPFVREPCSLCLRRKIREAVVMESARRPGLTGTPVREGGCLGAHDPGRPAWL